MPPAKPPRLTDLAAAISAHLKRIEASPKLNRAKWGPDRRMLYGAVACQGGRFVRVVYIGYHGATSLTRDEAAAYLAWLDAGGLGTHYHQQRATP